MRAAIALRDHWRATHERGARASQLSRPRVTYDSAPAIGALRSRVNGKTSAPTHFSAAYSSSCARNARGGTLRTGRSEHDDGTYIGIDVGTACYYARAMGRAKRITANLPEDLLNEAMSVTRKGITETLVEGLNLVRRARGFEKAMALRGKVRLDVDLEASRERSRR